MNSRITRVILIPFHRFLLFLIFLFPFGVVDMPMAAGNPAASTTCPVRPPVSGAQAVKMLEGARSSERLFGFPGLSNVGRVASGICRGAMLGPGGYATLKRMGIRTVVNLRAPGSEKKQVEAAGMRSVEIPLNMLGNGDIEKVDRVVEIMADPAQQPVFVHCKLGVDQTGIVVAAYRMKIEGWPLGLAEAEMESFGFNGIGVNLRRFLQRYAAGLEQRKQIKTTH
jgi:tyrosine-protein phosphatase SIW14